jgi:hypothetical protein
MTAQFRSVSTIEGELALQFSSGLDNLKKDRQRKRPLYFGGKYLFAFILHGWNFLLLHTTQLHLLPELVDIANSREEMRLSTSIRIKSGEPSVPLQLFTTNIVSLIAD